jgi:hypothetical protein
MQHKTPHSEYPLQNYCVSFIDLLGQRNALAGQGVLPEKDSDEYQKLLGRILKKSIGATLRLQEDAEEMLRATMRSSESPLREKLPEEMRPTWDKMHETEVTIQRWSDGIVSFAGLGNPRVTCHMNDVFRIFISAAAMCYMGLARQSPVRGAIEIAWGMELRRGELYGAYELESEIAQYPRIVVGPLTLEYLTHKVNMHATTQPEILDRELAKLCLSMLLEDADGYYFLHFLGESFQSIVTKSNHTVLHEPAHKFVREQFDEHQKKKNSKLAFRYLQLLRYFNAHKVA